jgi:hypothetical protein
MSIEPKSKRRGPKPPPPVPEGVDPLAGPLRLEEAGGVMRKSPQTVRKLADLGELEWVDTFIWGPSVASYFERHRVAGKRPANPANKPGPGRPRKGGAPRAK